MVGGLAEPDPGVDQEVRWRDTGLLGARDGCRQVVHHLADDVVVVGLRPVVHDEERYTGTRRQVRHPGILSRAPDVVEQVRARREGRLGDDHLGRVDAQRDVGQGVRDRGHDGDHAPDLVRGIDRRVTRAGRLATDIEQIGALLDHAPRLLDRCTDRVGGSQQAITRERVGRHVEDAHHERPFAPAECHGSDPGGRRGRQGGRVVALGGHGAGGSRSSGSSTRCARTAPTR